MKRFIIKSLLIIFPPFLFISLWLLIYGFSYPHFSNSLSFNAKIQNIYSSHLDDSVDVMAVGSSMCLNNLHTKTIKNRLSKKYINISSMGQNIQETYFLIKVFNNYYHPKILLISSYLGDFGNVHLPDFELVKEYLSDGLWGVYNKVNLKKLLFDSFDYYQAKKKGRTEHECLLYDECGGVNLSDDNFNINPNRWKGGRVDKISVNETQYDYLDSIAIFCNLEGIRLVFVDAPFREGFYSQLDKKDLSLLYEHKSKVDSILQGKGHLFINAQTDFWDDSLFVDILHLKSKGAERYTNFLLNQME